MAEGESLSNDVRPLFNYLKGIKYYTLDGPVEPEATTDIITEEEYQVWLSQYNSTGDCSNSVIMRLLHMSFQRGDDLDEIRSLLGPDGLGLMDRLSVRSYDFPSTSHEHEPSATKKYHFIYFLPTNPPEGVFPGFRFNELSVGMRRIIEILVSLVFDKSSVMLIEHPEDGIHSGLTKKLIGLLKSV